MVYFNLAPSPVDAIAESATTLIDTATTAMTKNVLMFGNAAICADSICTTGRAGINFYCSPSPLAKVFFVASCACGVVGATSSGVHLKT